jgi:hypothetical protein
MTSLVITPEQFNILRKKALYAITEYGHTTLTVKPKQAFERTQNIIEHNNTKKVAISKSIKLEVRHDDNSITIQDNYIHGGRLILTNIEFPAGRKVVTLGVRYFYNDNIYIMPRDFFIEV